MAVSTGMVAVMNFFELGAAKFRTEWAALSDESKVQLKEGIGSFDKDTGRATGSLTY